VKAVVMTAVGGPEVLELQEVAEPEFQQDTDLLIQVKAAGVNPIDTKIRKRGTFYPDLSPAVLGCDGAGIVEAVGPKVRQFHIGDQVYFCHGGLGGPGGNYAEYAVVNERFVSHKPNSLSFEEAAAAPLVLITAWESLFDRGGLEAGRQVLIHAGAGGVGHVAIQLAKIAGAIVCTTVSSEEKANFVYDLGVDQAILYPQSDFVEKVLEWTNGQGVDLSLDTVGGDVLSKTFAATRFYGDVVTLLAPPENTDWKTVRDRNLRVSLELMLTPMLKGLTDARSDQVKILQQCARLFDQQKLRVVVNQVLPLAEAAEAHRLIEQGGMMGKVVLAVGE
jgi:NADPH2:quinone reductase